MRPLLFPLLLLSSLALSVLAQTPPPTFQNASNPVAVFHTGLNTLNSRSWPDCAWDLHKLIGRGQSKAFYQFGGQSATYSGGWSNIQWRGDLDFSNNPSFGYGYTSTFTPSFSYNWTGTFTGYSPVSRVSGMTAVLSNGNVILMAGKTAPNWAWSNDVIYSTNAGLTFSQATAAAQFSPRSDAAMAVAPGTNNVVLAGGSGASGYLNDVWLNSDGTGASWTLQATNPWMGFQQGAMTFLYDGSSVSSSYTQAFSTLVLYNPSDNNIWHSLDLGKSWSMIAAMSVQGEDPQQTGRMAADLENYLYLAGGVQIGPQVYFSTDKGYSWQLLDQSAFYPGLRIADPMSVVNFQYGCLAINYVAAAGSPNGYHKQLIEYGGYITAVQDVNSYYGCTTNQGVASYTSVVAELVFPGETVTPFGQGAAAGGQFSIYNATLIFHDAADQLIYRAYSDFTYDTHAAITRNSTVRMWQFGGFDMAWNFIPTTDFTPTGNWNVFSTFTPTYNSKGYATPSGRVAAGVGLLYNGALLMFGGKDSNASTFNNDVYMTMDNGQSWTLSTYSAAWSQRSDMVVAVMPGTNTIVMGGGQGNPNALNLGDFYICTDGVGAQWTRQTAGTSFGVFQDAAFVALYDNNKVSSTFTSQYSTLLINPGIISSANADGIWKSIDGGATWTGLGTAPWTQRIRGNFVADRENYVYMLGGFPATGDIWASADSGVTWSFLLQQTTSSVWPNTFSFQSGQQNALALRYSSNPASPNGYHKQLVLWGGAASPSNNLLSIQVSQQPAPSCVRTLPVNVVYAEIMFPTELSNPSFTDTLSTAAVNTNAPTIAYNSPTPLLTYRQYAGCAADVHALISGATPNSYALGGWDVNGNSLATLDRISGNNLNSYSYIAPRYGRGYQAAMGRTSGMAAVTSSGILIWGGGKVGLNRIYGNDVWYSIDQGQSFNISTESATWSPRSDSATAAVPGTNCVIMVGGQGVSVTTGNFETGQIFFNDVWSSCDSFGSAWTLQTATAPFAPAQQASLVALYDNTGSASAPTNTLVYYSWADQFIRTSNTLGKTWTTVGEVAWSQRFTRFTADLSNNIYAAGGMNPNGNVGDSSSFNNGIGDSWISSDKGKTWTRLTQVTNVGYPTPVTLSTASYSCATMLYSGGHRQLMVYSNWIEVYSPQTSFVASRGWGGAPAPQCVCDSLSGIRGLVGDLLFPGETPAVGQSSGGGGTSYSAGATAGIAVGCAVGVGLLCCLAMMFLVGGSRLGGKGSSIGKSKQFEDEPSTVSQQSNVEMPETTSSP